MKRRSKISLNALRVFEAVARNGTMTQASAELGVTPGAVSRQIAELQTDLSFALFQGGRKDRVLTSSGRQLALVVTSALDDIDATLRALDENRSKTLDVACLSTFAIRWLIPRLHRFRALHPSLDLRLSTDPRPPDRTHSRRDVSIMVLAPSDVRKSQDCPLFDESLGPVVAPHLYGADRSGDLLGLPRLASATRPNAWALWLRSYTGSAVAPTQVTEFEHLSFAIEAAVSGLGVCVSPEHPEHLVRRDLQQGRLSAPFGFDASGYSYVARPHGRRKASVDAFGAWLQAEIGEQDLPLGLTNQTPSTTVCVQAAD